MIHARDRGAPAPAAPQVCTLLPEHCTAPGLHEPVQTPETHAEPVQADVLPHCPFAWQVCTPLPEHCTAPGVHTPVQAPLTQAWFEHATAAP